MTVLLALCWWLGRRNARARKATFAAGALFFLTLGLCAAAPIAISPKVSGHYFLPAIPMFALGFASIAHRFVVTPLESRRPAMVSAVTLALASILALVFLFGPGRSRDAVMLRDLDAIDRVMPRDLTIGACRHPRSSRDWGLHTYAQRWFRVSLDARDIPINGWLLRLGEDCAAPPSCLPVARGDTLTLFRCPDSLQRTSK